MRVFGEIPETEVRAILSAARKHQAFDDNLDVSFVRPVAEGFITRPKHSRLDSEPLFEVQAILVDPSKPGFDKSFVVRGAQGQYAVDDTYLEFS